MDNIDVNQNQRKKSLCRFYLRGLCFYKQEQCQFGHGIKDLDYEPWQQGQDVEFDYLQDTPFTQKKAEKGKRSYINLYEFQNEKKYSLEEINSQRVKRVEVRTQMHQQMFHDFMDLIEERYPMANFTQSVLLREYTRVGFNKLMTRIKFSHLTDLICQGDRPRYFMKSIIMPPLVKKTQNYILKQAQEDIILECYRNELKRIFTQNKPEDINEGFIKKQLFVMTFPSLNIPPYSQFLKQKKMNFSQFLTILKGQEENMQKQVLKQQTTVEQIVAIACKILENQAKDKLLAWGDLFSLLSKQVKINNGNIINQSKAYLVLENYYFLRFPIHQFIIKKQQNYPFLEQSRTICKCNMKQPVNISQYDQLLTQGQVQMKEEESVDINDWSSLVKYGKIILESKTLAVDLEGTLRRGGTIELIQLCNYRNTFIFDFHAMTVKQDHKTIELSKKILRNAFTNENILKIFHDCRHDTLMLHQVINTCVINIFDTSAIQTLKCQLQKYKSIQHNEQVLTQAKNIIAECNNVRSWSINDILKRYSASHGFNIYKEKFQQMWRDGKGWFFLMRPIDPEYRWYCIYDVLDLPEVKDKIAAQMTHWEVQLGKWVSAQYVAFGYELTKPKKVQ